jgi:CMP-N-acetylneuraminic acid synthetase
MTIAIIIARGGSRRLPRKNVKPFCGHPLVAWAITQARCSNLVDKVYVSTDDDEIEAISKKYGAEVIRRPDWPDADLASATRPLLHATRILMERFGDAFNTMVCMLPTRPLVLPGDIDRAIQEKTDSGEPNIVFLKPERQTVVYKKLNKYRARTAIFAKHYEYLSGGPGFNVTSPRYSLRCAEIQVEVTGDDTDKTADAKYAEGGDDITYIPCEYWQYADTDTAEEFEFGEVLMEHYILKGRGMAVYEEYAAQKHLAGNWRQQ